MKGADRHEQTVVESRRDPGTADVCAVHAWTDRHGGGVRRCKLENGNQLRDFVGDFVAADITRRAAGSKGGMING